MATTFKLNGIYRFDLQAPSILGASLKNVTVVSTMTERSAIRAGLATREIHAKIYSQLPVGTPNNPDAYTYVEFRTMSGETVIMGLPWIKQESIEEITLRPYNVRFDDLPAVDLERLSHLLLTGGFKKFTIALAE